MTISSDDARAEASGIIKIIGMGQSLRGDDGAGLAAVRLWQETIASKTGHPHVQVELVELPGLALLDLIQGARFVILVDAVRSHAEPGTIHVLTAEQLEAFSGGTSSAHGWGVAETLALGKKLELSSMPQKLMLIGIEAGDLTLGESLSLEVKLALPEAVRMIEQLVASG